MRKKILTLQPNKNSENYLHNIPGMECITDIGRIDEADAIFFDGGPDISTDMYNEKNIKALNPDVVRDRREMYIFAKTRKTHYHFGICRGSQFLWVANGGTLWQDITGHAIYGTHGLNTVDGKRIKGVTSTHHQAARVNADMQDRVLAYETFHEPVKAVAFGIETTVNDVVEAHYHPSTRSLGIQGHPEFTSASKEYREYVNYLLCENEATKI